MTAPLPAYFTPHTVSVRDRLAGTSMGARYAEPREVAAFAADEQKLVRDAAGLEVVSTSQVTVAFDEQIPVGSLVTVWPGAVGAREAEVVAISRNQHPTLPSFQTLSLA